MLLTLIEIGLLPCVVFVWLLAPIPYRVQRWLQPTVTHESFIMTMIDLVRLELSNAVVCDKCTAFWSGVLWWSLKGFAPLTVIGLACLNVVLTKLLNRYVY